MELIALLIFLSQGQLQAVEGFRQQRRKLVPFDACLSPCAK